MTSYHCRMMQVIVETSEDSIKLQQLGPLLGLCASQFAPAGDCFRRSDLVVQRQRSDCVARILVSLNKTSHRNCCRWALNNINGAQSCLWKKRSLSSLMRQELHSEGHVESAVKAVNRFFHCHFEICRMEEWRGRELVFIILESTAASLPSSTSSHGANILSRGHLEDENTHCTHQMLLQFIWFHIYTLSRPWDQVCRLHL